METKRQRETKGEAGRDTEREIGERGIEKSRESGAESERGRERSRERDAQKEIG